MKRFTHVKLSGLFLAGLCLVSVFALGTGSASARPQLLFVPTLGYPYHLVGSSPKEAVLATTGGTSIKSPSQHVLALVLNSSLFNARIEFLKVTSSLGGNCQTTGSGTGNIVINLLGHLGLIDPGLEPGVLLLLPSGGFEFECTGTSVGNIKVKVTGQVIGLISSPAVGVASELLTIKFEQSGGVQRWKTFLLWNEQLTNQHLTSTILFTEESGQSGEATLHALPKEGTFKIILDP